MQQEDESAGEERPASVGPIAPRADEVHPAAERDERELERTPPLRPAHPQPHAEVRLRTRPERQVRRMHEEIEHEMREHGHTGGHRDSPAAPQEQPAEERSPDDRPPEPMRPGDEVERESW